MSETACSGQSLGEEPGTWCERLRVRSYDVDVGQRLRLESLCRYFQEAAWNHAEALGVGYGRLAEQNKVWVLSRLLVRVQRCPIWGEALLMRTWPRTAKPIFALRDFELTTDTGTRLAAGTSAWLVLDAKSRRPQRVAKLVASFKRFPEKRALENDPEKLPGVEPGAAIGFAQDSSSTSRQVQYSDLDVNGHVNGARYIGWLLDAYPLEFLREHTATSLEMNYLGETRAEEMVSIRLRRVNELEYGHSVYKTDGGAEVCRARLVWKARE